MDRNSIIGIVLIAVIFFVWSIFSNQNKEREKEEKARQERILDTITDTPEGTAPTGTDATPGKGMSDDQTSPETYPEPKPESTDAPGRHYKNVYLENDLVKIKLSEWGGQPVSAILQKYKTYNQDPVNLFDTTSHFGFDVLLKKGDEYLETNTRNLYFATEHDDNFTLNARKKPQQVRFTYWLDSIQQRYIEYTYSLTPGKYQVDLQVHFHNMGDITNRKSSIPLTWMVRVPQQEKGRDNELNYTSIYYRFKDNDVEHFNARRNKDQNESHQTPIEWIAYKDQFFTSVIMPETPFATSKMDSRMEPDNSDYLKQFSSTVTLDYAIGKDNTLEFDFYFGPVKYRLLKREYGDKKLHNLVEMGNNIVKWINQGIIVNLFDFLNRFISNYGIIILLMTIIIKVFLLPLTFRSYMSTAKMRVLKPQIDEINKKIPKEKAMERQQATMALYKKVGVSPLGGCLPMLLQMPILFAMFRFFPTSIELRQQSFLWAKDLSTYDAIIEWSGNIPLISSTFGNHLSLFTLLMTVSTILSMRFNNQTSGTQTMPGMKTMMYIMPVVFMFILNRYSAGLTYYYFLANVISIGQNFLFKAFINEEELLQKLEARKAKPRKKSKFMQRLEELQRQQQAQKGKPRRR